jgi:hypothetical protein
VSRLALAAALVLAAGCAPRLSSDRTPRADTVVEGEARVRIVSWPEDAASAGQVAAAVRAALARTARWGGLAEPVTITVHPTHDALEAAIGRRGYPWLRAWATYDRIELQAPATWGWLGLGGGTDQQVEQLLTHELTHCVMYQQAAGEWNWSYKGIPVWFREGLASVTAEQERRRLTVEQLWRFYEGRLPMAGSGDGVHGAHARAAQGRTPEEGDPLSNPEPLVRENDQVVYGAAHHAFRFLLDRYGESRVRAILADMKGGATFDVAFRTAVGIGEAEFVNDFRRYLVWQGWRR